MYTQRRYPFKSVLTWTKRELIFFTILSSAFTIAFELVGIKWLQVPLAPVGLIGTAVAFMVGFQNNAAYDRIWEARKIWGGIVNTSRSFVINMKDSFIFITMQPQRMNPLLLKSLRTGILPGSLLCVMPCEVKGIGKHRMRNCTQRFLFSTMFRNTELRLKKK